MPAPRKTVSRAKRESARDTRRSEGAAESARPHTGEGEGDPIPQATPKVSEEARRAARNKRKQEAARANKAGDITSKRERSY